MLPIGGLTGGLGGAGPIGGEASATSSAQTRQEFAQDLRSGAGLSEEFGTFQNNVAFPGGRVSAGAGEVNTPFGLGDSLKWLVPGFLALMGLLLVGRMFRKG